MHTGEAGTPLGDFYKLNTTIPAPSGDTSTGGDSDSLRRSTSHRKRPYSESVSVRWWRRDAAAVAAGDASAGMQWEDLTATSAVNVHALTMHTMTVVEGIQTHMVIFGGLKSAQEATSALYTLDLDDVSALWMDKSGRSDAPIPRFGHSAAAMNGRLFVYGGWTQIGGTPDGGLYVFDVVNAAWKSLANLPGKPSYGRALCTMVTVSWFGERESVCVFLHVFDVANAAWKSLVNVPGKSSYGRALCTMATVSYFGVCFFCVFWCVCVCVFVCVFVLFLVCMCLASLRMGRAERE